ncbi:MAG: GNAT family N-acetyltransferase [Acidobacteriota bacterium]
MTTPFTSRTSLRPVSRDDDRELLYQIYASTRTEELSVVDWDDAQKETFLRFQFEAQRRYYEEQFPDAAFDIILHEGEPAGRLYIDRRDDEIRLVDIALLPDFRGRGLGGEILADLLGEGRGAGLPVRIHVEHNNPAMRLYLRLGFVKIEEQGVYHLMEWRPDAPGTAEGRA